MLQTFYISNGRQKYSSLLQKHFGMTVNLVCVYLVRQLKSEVFLQKFTRYLLHSLQGSFYAFNN